MGGLSLRTDFDQYTEDIALDCWSFRPLSPDDDTTSQPDTNELPRSVIDAQATLQRITPSITNLMIAAIKHNRSSVDVYPLVQRMSGQAYALKVELERIGQTLDRAVASVKMLDKDFGRLAAEARQSGLTGWE